jgi:hypothetical protein
MNQIRPPGPAVSHSPEYAWPISCSGPFVHLPCSLASDTGLPILCSLERKGRPIGRTFELLVTLNYISMTMFPSGGCSVTFKLIGPTSLLQVVCTSWKRLTSWINLEVLIIYSSSVLEWNLHTIRTPRKRLKPETVHKFELVDHTVLF